MKRGAGAHDGTRPPTRRGESGARSAPIDDGAGPRGPEPGGRRAEPPTRRAEPAATAQRAKLNAEWHARHPVPRGATMRQRLQWHLDHQRHCGCRPMPLKLQALLARGMTPSREPWRRPREPREG